MPQHDHDQQPHGARETAAQVLHDARDKAEDAYKASKATAKDTAARAARGVDGALIPRSAREKELLAPVGKRLGDTARQAFAAAKDAGRQELDQAGLTPSAAKDRGRELLDGVVKAVSSAGSAAARSAKRTEQA
jgi:hypothetical protein